MQTEILYLDNSYLTEFNAHVVQSFFNEGQFIITLDKTAFYPTSGGQMFDTGFIDGIRVIKVIEKENQILHFLESELKNENVSGKINWDRRFDFMQQHTAFHILAQSFFQVLQAETLASHLGENISTIDVNINEIDFSQIEQVEKLANEICMENRPVRHFYISPEDIEKYSLRANPTKGEKIRLIEIEDFDLDPCGGTHVNTTGQVGIIKIIRWERLRSILRFEFCAGKRALRDYQKKWRITFDISKMLTESAENLPTSVQKMQTEMKSLIKKNSNLNKQNLDFEVKELISGTKNEKEKIIKKIFQDRELADIRYLANQVISQSDRWVLFGLQKEKPNLIFACPETYNYNLNNLLQQVIHLINGRGGGRPNFVEAGGNNLKGIDEALESARLIIENSVFK